ncbi:GntR family transcriptional regulator [Rhodococcus sp. RD6.2]|uniref:FadR/GntR family transcriptional regulator n=1 Tax=Rhodococcus sp. RD6.2 TaxID=260936 RepID=UPI00063B606F|nr:GntR family transcriptional regulator [Rhodococcus sp. RD6.2]CRK52788.1 GntR family transcriptional regulator [Rhodococcus sp. RD6.2]
MGVVAKSSVVRVPKAGELVAASLRRRIITGELSAGDPLPNEAALMEQFGVSRPTLREAFRILESESIITVLRGAHGGARVLAPDSSGAARYTGLLLQYQGVPLVDVYRARASLEVTAVGTLADGTHDAELGTFAALLEAGADLMEDPEAFARHDVDVHQALIDLAGNQTLSVLSGMLVHIIDAHNDLFIASKGDDLEQPAAQRAHRSYLRLLALMRDGDPIAAQQFWRKHLDAIERVMLSDPETTLVEVLS